MQNDDFFNKVKQVVMCIPQGKVTTYGAIGKFLGLRSSARMVGWALNSFAGNINIPCRRVVNRNGELSGKMHFENPFIMEERLKAEGVSFNGEKVNLAECFWDPADII